MNKNANWQWHRRVFSSTLSASAITLISLATANLEAKAAPDPFDPNAPSPTAPAALPPQAIKPALKRAPEPAAAPIAKAAPRAPVEAAPIQAKPEPPETVTAPKIVEPAPATQEVIAPEIAKPLIPENLVPKIEAKTAAPAPEKLKIPSAAEKKPGFFANLKKSLSDFFSDEEPATAQRQPEAPPKAAKEPEVVNEPVAKVEPKPIPQIVKKAALPKPLPAPKRQPAEPDLTEPQNGEIQATETIAREPANKEYLDTIKQSLGDIFSPKENPKKVAVELPVELPKAETPVLEVAPVKPELLNEEVAAPAPVVTEVEPVSPVPVEAPTGEPQKAAAVETFSPSPTNNEAKQGDETGLISRISKSFSNFWTEDPTPISTEAEAVSEKAITETVARVVEAPTPPKAITTVSEAPAPLVEPEVAEVPVVSVKPLSKSKVEQFSRDASPFNPEAPSQIEPAKAPASAPTAEPAPLPPVAKAKPQTVDSVPVQTFVAPEPETKPEPTDTSAAFSPTPEKSPDDGLFSRISRGISDLWKEQPATPGEAPSLSQAPAAPTPEISASPVNKLTTQETSPFHPDAPSQVEPEQAHTAPEIEPTIQLEEKPAAPALPEAATPVEEVERVIEVARVPDKPPKEEPGFFSRLTSGVTSLFSSDPEEEVTPAAADGGNEPEQQAKLTPPAQLPEVKASPEFYAAQLGLGQNVKLGGSITSLLGEDKPVCVARENRTKHYCMVKVDWVPELQRHFKVSSVIYRGTKSLVQFDGANATRLYALFPTEDFNYLAANYVRQYGKPTFRTTRKLRTLISGTHNSTILQWKRVEKDGKTVTIFELRQVDDVRSNLPDLEHGVLRIFFDGTTPIFSKVSTLDFFDMD